MAVWNFLVNVDNGDFAQRIVQRVNMEIPV